MNSGFSEKYTYESVKAKKMGNETEKITVWSIYQHILPQNTYFGIPQSKAMTNLDVI